MGCPVEDLTEVSLITAYHGASKMQPHCSRELWFIHFLLLYDIPLVNTPSLTYPPRWINFTGLGCFQFGVMAALSILEKSDGIY